jgi:DNA-binding NtrC family response regulator
VPDKLEEARSLLEKRLAELDAERDQLTAAIKQLDGVITGSGNGSSSRPRRTQSRSRSNGSSTKRSSGGSRKRARRGQREKQLLSSIEAHPDFRVSDHAREVGVSPQQLYPLLNRLVAKDAIVKKDSKYRLKM